MPPHSDPSRQGATVENEMLATSVSATTGKRVFGGEVSGARQVEESYFRELVAAILAGETARFEEIVTLFRDRIYRIAWKMAQDREDALDISQEVFLRAFRALRSWHGRARFSTWLHRIAINASIDYIRRRAKHRDTMESFDEMEPARLSEVEATCTQADHPRRQAYAAELRREIFKAIRCLPARQRHCFVLRHYHECTIRDMAAVLHVSEGTVKRHLHRATRRLRRTLAARLGWKGE